MESLIIACDSCMNSPCLDTIVSGILAGLLVFATVMIAVNQYRQQRKIQEQNLLLSRENRILDIYNTYVDCEKSFIRLFSATGPMLVVVLDDSKERELMEHRVKLRKALNVAKLLFEENTEIIQRLETLFDTFRDLSEKNIELASFRNNNISKAFQMVVEQFPQYHLNKLDDLGCYRDAFQRFYQLIDSPELRDLSDEIESFLRKGFSDENFDNLFKPYINRIQQR